MAWHLERHDALVHNIYDASTDSEAWSRLPERITTDFGARAMFFADGQSHDPTSFSVNSFRFTNELLEENGFTLADHFDPNSNLGYGVTLSAPVARGIEGHRYYAIANERQKIFFQKCASDFGTPFVRSFLSNRHGNEVSGGFITYGGAFDPFHGQDTKRFDTVLSHLSRAVEIRSKLDIAHRTSKTLGDQLDALKTSVLIIDRSQRVLYLNQSADELVQTDAGISINSGKFRVTDLRAKKRFESRFASLAQTTDDAIDAPIQLRGMSDQPALQAWIYPAVGFALSNLPSASFACIVIRDPVSESGLVDQKLLIAAFDLTPAEARVVQLTPLGLSIEKLATKLGVSPNTVKTHLSNARAKVSVRRTPELAQMVLKLQR